MPEAPQRSAEDQYESAKLREMNEARRGIDAGRAFFKEQGVADSIVDIVAEQVARAAGAKFEQALSQNSLVAMRTAIDKAAGGSAVQGFIAARAQEQVDWFEDEWREILDRQQQFAQRTRTSLNIGGLFKERFGHSLSAALVVEEQGAYVTLALLVDPAHLDSVPGITRSEASAYSQNLLHELGALQPGDALDSLKSIPLYREPGEEGPIREPDMHKSRQIRVSGLPTKIPGMTVQVRIHPERVSPNIYVAMDIPTFQRGFNLKVPQGA